jgi:hypothetical protein
MLTTAQSDQKIRKANVGFEVTPEFKERLEAFRRQEGERSISDVCRRLLEAGLRDYAI